MADRERAAGWSGAAYSAASDHHRVLDDWFLDRLRPDPTATVVDLGCGSGVFAARVAAEVVPEGRVIGVEPDPSMLDAARQHDVPNLEVVSASAQQLDQVVDAESVDLVMSRAMLHWLPFGDYPRVFDAVAGVLKPGGWYHSESAAAGNVPRVFTAINSVGDAIGVPVPPAFPDPGAVYEVLEEAGFDIPDEGVRSVVQRRPFTRDQMVGLLRTQAAVALTRDADPERAESIIEAVAAKVDDTRRFDGTYDQTFVRLEILVRRPA